MNVHIALYKWKSSVTQNQIDKVFDDLIKLGPKIPGLTSISCARNKSRYSEGYTHVILVMGESQNAIDAYRSDPEHAKIASAIDNMEDHGIGVDFETD